MSNRAHGQWKRLRYDGPSGEAETQALAVLIFIADDGKPAMYLDDREDDSGEAAALLELWHRRYQEGIIYAVTGRKVRIGGKQ